MDFVDISTNEIVGGIPGSIPGCGTNFKALRLQNAEVSRPFALPKYIQLYPTILTIFHLYSAKVVKKL